MARELERRRQQTASFADCTDLARQVAAGRLAGELLEHGLRIEQVHLAGPTCHEKLDDGLRPAREVRLFWLEIVDSRLHNARRAEITTQEKGESRAMQAIRHGGKEIPASGSRGCHIRRVSQHKGTPRN